MKRAESGFSMVEVMIAIVLVGILVVIAVPMFQEQVAKRRLEGLANELSADLQYARTEAVSKNRQVQLISAADGKSYSIQYVTAPVSAAQLKIASFPVGITASPDVAVRFDALRGMAATVGAMTLSSIHTTGTLRASATVVGRITLCSPGGGFIGYATC